ncbi:thioesterase II family protein [Streptomyces viridochromogenes]|uniref:thioesterase II family protein n=1 Tax=Streptomyces viridochromogenes TaxID=1938 RepID=UPI0006917799|nr:alpha/beta fold hydrolase [Streptomyces viridochromogenes]
MTQQQSRSRARTAPRWTVARPARPDAAVRLFCFPYAGGGSSIFRSWHTHLDDGIEVCPVLLPGREERYSEPAFTRADALVAALAEHLAPVFDKPFAFFGHSMGGQIAFALARHLAAVGAPTPSRLFLAGCVPQHSRVLRHELPDEQLVAEIREMNGAPPEVLANEEVLQLLLPMIRADFALAEDSVPPAEAQVTTPVTAFAGADDPEAGHDEVRLWARHTTGSFESFELKGDHFFLHQPAALLDLVARRLTTPVPRPAG